MSSTIAIIDYGCGNVYSVWNICVYLGYTPVLVKTPKELLECRRAILPGVGAFGDAVRSLKKEGMDEALVEYVRRGDLLIGICLGMQLLFSGSEESLGVSGLGFFEGVFRRFLVTPPLKVPHIGWNQVEWKKDCDLEELDYMYFVHSYFLPYDNQSYVLGVTEHEVPFCSVVGRNNVVAFQGHPEKSQKKGIQCLQFVIEKEGV